MTNKDYMFSLRKKTFLFFLFIHKIHVSSHQYIDTLQSAMTTSLFCIRNTILSTCPIKLATRPSSGTVPKMSCQSCLAKGVSVYARYIKTSTYVLHLLSHLVYRRVQQIFSNCIKPKSHLSLN